MTPSTKDRTDKHTEVRIDLRIYPLPVVRKTAALISRRCTLELIQEAEHTVLLKIGPREDAPSLDDARAAFLALLSDAALQEEVAAQTRDVRIALLRAAFHEALPHSK